jgi:hypothetical protein
VTYRGELSGRALKQMQGLPDRAFDSLIEAMADVADYPDACTPPRPRSTPTTSHCYCPPTSGVVRWQPVRSSLSWSLGLVRAGRDVEGSLVLSADQA